MHSNYTLYSVRLTLLSHWLLSITATLTKSDASRGSLLLYRLLSKTEYMKSYYIERFSLSLTVGAYLNETIEFKVRGESRWPTN